MKVIFMKIRKMALDANYMPMGICILENFLKIKSMAEALFIGLISVKLHALRIHKPILSNIMDYGGADCQMVKGNIQNQMVFFEYNVGDYYKGNFKNGLKHGEGV